MKYLKKRLRRMKEEDFYDIIMNSKRVRNFAARILLLKIKLTTISLAHIIRHCSDSLGRKALKRLIKEDPSEETLNALLRTKRVSEFIKEKVSEELLKQKIINVFKKEKRSMTVSELCKILDIDNREIAEKAIKDLKEKNVLEINAGGLKYFLAK